MTILPNICASMNCKFCKECSSLLLGSVSADVVWEGSEGAQ